jgi:hypothetical protein
VGAGFLGDATDLGEFSLLLGGHMTASHILDELYSTSVQLLTPYFSLKSRDPIERSEFNSGATCLGKFGSRRGTPR